MPGAHGLPSLPDEGRTSPPRSGTGSTRSSAPATGPLGTEAELVALIDRSFRAFDEHPELIKAMLHTRHGRAARLSENDQRRAMAQRCVDDAVPGLDPERGARRPPRPSCCSRPRRGRCSGTTGTWTASRRPRPPPSPSPRCSRGCAAPRRPEPRLTITRGTTCCSTCPSPPVTPNECRESSPSSSAPASSTARRRRSRPAPSSCAPSTRPARWSRSSLPASSTSPVPATAPTWWTAPSSSEPRPRQLHDAAHRRRGAGDRRARGLALRSHRQRALPGRQRLARRHAAARAVPLRPRRRLPRPLRPRRSRRPRSRAPRPRSITAASELEVAGGRASPLVFDSRKRSAGGRR